MSTVYSELSLDYASPLGGANQISLFRIRTNDNNTASTSGFELNPLNAVPLAQRHLFEIQVVPSGDTGRIIRNDFGSGFTRMNSFKRLTHRVERAVSDVAGTTSGSLTCTVNVRRISYHTDAYSRQMVLNHSITTQGAVAPDPQPETGHIDDAFLPDITMIYLGLDQNMGTAGIGLYASPGVIEVLIEQRPINPGNRDIDFVQEWLPVYTFDANVPPSNQTETSIEVIGIEQTDNSIGANFYHNSTTNGPIRQTAPNRTRLWVQESSKGGGSWLYATLRIVVRRISDGQLVMRKRINLYTQSNN